MTNDQAGYVFYCAPGANTGDPVEDKLLRSHEAEAERHKAEFYNYGQVSGENNIESKTSKGRLVTHIDPKTMEVRHRWFTYAETGGPWDLAKAAANYHAAASELDKVGNVDSAKRHRWIADAIDGCLKQIGENPAEFAEICDGLAKATTKGAV
jgi:hypothetical protein